MADDGETIPARKVRADAERNRARLLDVAKAAFADKGPGASLDEIARAAGVGIGTLYRHFPTRDDLIEAVYLNETQQLAEAASRLGVSRAPVEALREWMGLFVDYIVNKRVLAETLGSLSGGTAAVTAKSGELLTTALTQVVDRAVASGDIQMDIDPFDLLRALAGVANISAGPDAKQGAKRLIDVLIAGLRPSVT